MYLNDKYIIDNKTNLIKSFTKNRIDKEINGNKLNGYSEQSSSDMTSITNNIIPSNKIVSLKTKNINSFTSIKTNKNNKQNNSISSYTEQKLTKKSPSKIFGKSLFTSIEDRNKIDILKKYKNLSISKKRNESINNLYNNTSFKYNSKEDNLKILLKNINIINNKLNSFDKKEKKVKFEEFKNDQNKIKIKFKEKYVIPKNIKKKLNLSLYNKNNGKNPIINKKMNIKIINEKINNSQNKNKLPNISMEEKSNKNNNIIYRNVKTDINRSISPKNIILNNNYLNSINLKKNEGKIKCLKNYEFIQKIKSRQLMNLYKRFKKCQRRNRLEELSFYKHRIFPIDTIRLLVSNRKELTIDKFRIEYINKLKNFSPRKYYSNYSSDSNKSYD